MEKKPFKDLFSKRSDTYAQYRPRYPASLFAYLASLVPDHRLAWDCATGNGQAALGLASHFWRVAATDASEAQIANAQRDKRVWYWISRAEYLGLPDHSLDLVTVAQAIHWFDLDAFYKEVRRVVRPGGVLAVWTYHLMQIAPDLNAILAHFYSDITGPYWSPRMHFVNERYRTLPFPFAEITAPRFTIEARWQLDDLFGFLSSWSVVQQFSEARGYHPLQDVEEALRAAWGDPAQERRVHWPLHFRIGQVT